MNAMKISECEELYKYVRQSVGETDLQYVVLSFWPRMSSYYLI